MIAKPFDRPELDKSYIPHSGAVQYLFDADVAGLVGRYAYTHDCWGTKAPSQYNRRRDLVSESAFLSAHKPLALDNELMLTDHVPPTLIKGIVVDEKDRAAVIASLREGGLIRSIGGVDHVVLSDDVREVTIPLDQFVKPGDRLTAEMWSEPSPYWGQIALTV